MGRKVAIVARRPAREPTHPGAILREDVLPAIGEAVASAAKKLGVSVYAYIKDRLSGANQMPSLAEIIREKAKHMHLGESWESNAASPNF